MSISFWHIAAGMKIYSLSKISRTALRKISKIKLSGTKISMILWSSYDTIRYELLGAVCCPVLERKMWEERERERERERE